MCGEEAEEFNEESVVIDFWRKDDWVYDPETNSVSVNAMNVRSGESTHFKFTFECPNYHTWEPHLDGVNSYE